MAILLWLGVGLAAGQEGKAAPEEKGLRESSRAEYGAELQRLGGVVEACRVKVSACDEKAVPADEEVSAEAGAQEFQVHWEWLRAALRKDAGTKKTDTGEEEPDESTKDPAASEKERLATLASAETRLREDAAILAGTAVAPQEGGARTKVEEVLARREFGEVQENRWWERMLAKLYGKVDDWFAQVKGVFPWTPWMGLLMEWGVLGAAAAALIVWALRMSKQQRVAFQAHREVSPVWQAESDDWAARAKANAANGEWREAVHCLYWSAIVMLEGQRLWRQNRARTPREYVGLLPPESQRRRALGGLTGVFERIWYGIRPATGEDYAKASALLDELRVG